MALQNKKCSITKKRTRQQKLLRVLKSTHSKMTTGTFIMTRKGLWMQIYYFILLGNFTVTI